MRRLLRHLLLLALGAVMAAGTMGALARRASAAALAPGTIAFAQANYTVHENQGYATITIHRSDASVEAWIRYGVRQASATNRVDFDAVPNSLAHFLPGQADYSFSVHIYDRGMNTPGSTVHATAYLFAHWSRWFRIRAYVPRGALDYQDLVLLERVAELDDAYQRGAQPTRDRPRRTWLRRTG